MDGSSIGARIELARKRAGMKQSELGEQLGVGVRMVHNYETGTTVPYDKLAAIAAATNVTREWLLTGEDRQAELGQRVEMLEAVLEQIRPGWRELLRPPGSLAPPREDDSHNAEDPDEPQNPPQDPEPRQP